MIETKRNLKCDRCPRVILEGVSDGREQPAVEWSMEGPSGSAEFRDLCPSCQKALAGIFARFTLAPKKKEQFPETVARRVAADKAAAGEGE